MAKLRPVLRTLAPEALSCANQKACRLMLELEKDAGLIERKRQGLGKPSLIYVKNFAVSS